jgi:hypothetical protein
MSNEIQVTIQLSCAKGEFYQPALGTPQSVDQNGLGGGNPGFINVGASEEDVSLGDLTTPGYCYIKNLGPLTGTAQPVITFGPKSGGAMVGFCSLKTGEEACFRLTDTTPTLRIVSDIANTGVQIVILED